MEKPKLFETQKHFILTMTVLFMLFLLHLGWEYRNYTEFIAKPFFFTHADVLLAYTKQKRNRSYQVLKLHSDEGLDFYTTTHNKRDFSHHDVRVQIFPDERISFWDYLGTFYVKSRIKDVQRQPVTLKERLLENVSVQHSEPELQAFYHAIFFATPLPKALREQIGQLGISHLVALSGFHLGILWGLVYGLAYLIYRPFQQRFFPYRHALADVGTVTVLVLGFYLWFVDFPPSLVRSYAMVVAGWVVLLLGIELLSFGFLATILLSLLVLFPSLSVSLAFWLSVSGVFYIFLLLHHGRYLNKWVISFLLIPFGIFLLMLPVVHGVFPVTSSYQLLSPFLSLLFIPFYPFVMLSHLLGVGGVLDEGLKWLFALPQKSSEALLPLWAVVLYTGASVGAVWSRTLFYLLLGSAAGYGIYLFI
jgi:competence protein ComEC